MLENQDAPPSPTPQVYNNTMTGVISTKKTVGLKTIFVLLILSISIILNLSLAYLFYSRNIPLIINDQARKRPVTRNDEFLLSPLSLSHPSLRTVALIYSFNSLKIKKVTGNELEVENGNGLRIFNFTKNTEISRQKGDVREKASKTDLKPGQDVEIVDSYIYNKGWTLQQVRILDSPSTVPATF